MAILLISSGTGPGECQQTVGHIVNRMMSEAAEQGLTLDVTKRAGRHGPVSAVVVARGGSAAGFAARWTGSIQWHCASSLRPKHKRKNWFAQVYVLPEPPLGTAIDPREAEMVAIRAGGPGGQHVNKTSSAVRATWRDYAVVVRDQRSQHQNRRLALERLQALVDADVAEAVANRNGTAHWLHHQVQRGNPARMFEGPGFVER